MLLPFASSAHGDTFPTWTGTTPGDWQIGTNWSTGNVPVIGDTVTLGSAASGSIYDGTGNNMFVSQINFTGTNTLTITANSGLQDFIIGPGAATEGINVASNAGTLNISTSTSNVDFNINGSASFVNNSTNTLNFINTGMFISAGTSSCVLTIDGPGNQSYNSYFGNNGSSTFGMVKNGSGTLLLNANPGSGNTNYWTGGFTINAGVVGIGGGNTVSGATGGNTLYLNGGVLYLNANAAKTVPATDKEVIGGNFTFGLVNSGTATGNLAFNGPVDLGNSNYTLTFNGPAVTFFSGGVTDGGFTKSGTSTLSFSAVQATYSGPTIINQGVVSGTNTSYVLSPNSDFTINGGTLRLNTVAQRIGSLSGTGVVTLGASGSLYTGNDGASTTFSGTIIGTGTNPSVTALVKEGSGQFNLTSTAGNTFYGATLINGGVLGVLQDNDLGNSANAVTINSATLLATGTFTTARTINLNGSPNTIDATGTNVLTLTGSVGTGDLTKGTNSGTLQLAQAAGYSTSGNVNVNGGTLLVGPTGGETGAFSVGNTLTINDGATVSVAAGVPSNSVTNSAATLTINGGGQLNLANSALLTTTSSSTIRQYLINGYNGGAWNGTAGINSVNAAADHTANGASATRALGYSTGTTFATLGLSAGQTLVKFTIYGDANLDGTVDITDLNTVLSNFLSGNPGTWDTGDFNYDGATDISDLNVVLSNYLSSAPSTVRTGVAKASASPASTAKTLTGTVSPADTTTPPAQGLLELVVNTTSGDVELEGNNADIASLQITSNTGGIITANWTDLKANGYANWTDTAKKKTGIGEFDNQFTVSGDYAVLGVVDYGDIYNTSANAEDYVFKYGSVESNDTTVDTDVGSVIYVSGVPEPTTLGLMGLAAAGLLGRRRRNLGSV